jgi:hypothetical protein
MGGALNSGSSIEWWTPPEIFDALGIGFDLDPCAPMPPAAPWLPTAERICLPGDGLEAPWFGRVWLNPPYGREAAAWVAKLADHGDGIALVFNRADAKWCQDAITRASAICLIRGRLSFIDGAGRERKGHNAANGSMLIAFGAECARAVLNCGLGVSLPVGQPKDHTPPYQGVAGEEETNDE